MKCQSNLGTFASLYLSPLDGWGLIAVLYPDQKAVYTTIPMKKKPVSDRQASELAKGW